MKGKMPKFVYKLDISVGKRGCIETDNDAFRAIIERLDFLCEKREESLELANTIMSGTKG